MQEKGGEKMQNHRQFFRVRLFDEPVILQSEHGFYHGIIRDLSGNGISLYLGEDIEFEECIVEFTLKDEHYVLSAKKVRKEKTSYGEYIYACTFTNLPEKTQSTILSLLLRLDAIRRKK